MLDLHDCEIIYRCHQPTRSHWSSAACCNCNYIFCSPPEPPTSNLHGSSLRTWWTSPGQSASGGAAVYQHIYNPLHLRLSLICWPFQFCMPGGTSSSFEFQLFAYIVQTGPTGQHLLRFLIGRLLLLLLIKRWYIDGFWKVSRKVRDTRNNSIEILKISRWLIKLTIYCHQHSAAAGLFYVLAKPVLIPVVWRGNLAPPTP